MYTDCRQLTGGSPVIEEEMRVLGDTGILAGRSGCLEYTEVSKDIVEYFVLF